MKISLLITFFLVSTCCFSQTKLIAHRSHSGSNKTFSIAQTGNFGLPPGYRDSITHKQDTAKQQPRQYQKKKSTPVTKTKKRSGAKHKAA